MISGSKESACLLEIPLLTVAMPIFNAGNDLRAAIFSIINQTFKNWELLIIDDGSTDSSVDNILDIDDSRLRIVRDGQNFGLAVRLNEAINLARGDFFARMDQDDISHPDRFAIQLQMLHAEPSLDLLGTQCVTISESNEIIGTLPKAESHENICASPWKGFYLPHPTWMGRTKWFRQHRYASPSPFCCEDQELLLRTHTCSRFYVLQQTLLAYRLRSYCNFGKARRTRMAMFRVQFEYFLMKEKYFAIFLSAIVLCMRIGMDARAVIKQLFWGANIQRAEHGVVDAQVMEWRQIIFKLEQQVSL